MKYLKKLLLGILFLLLLIVAASWFYLRSSGPEYNLNTTLSGLNEKVEVYYDEYAIPHTYAQNEEDAYRAFGYVLARKGQSFSTTPS